MAEGESGKMSFSSLISQQQNGQPFDQGSPPGYCPQQYSGQPGPVTVQPGMGQPYEYHSGNTTVIVQQQQILTRPPMRDWSTGICGCFEDMASCCAVFWCTSCYACYLSNKLGETCCLPLAISGFGSLIPLRTKVRTANNIRGSICEDCCMVFWCPACVMCQLSREHDYIQLKQQQIL
ncbi:placenta-specific gene 8 protein-like [Saccostrea echinata]|uniref:placenta-specific gene 8 protein-like n=1 Tax=Saccostrea echinata TaxID=191078 RepID=UPI002A813F2C|nr:placenta-specific gene 8 protein-like [Saccostrea echinata]